MPAPRKAFQGAKNAKTSHIEVQFSRPTGFNDDITFADRRPLTRIVGLVTDHDRELAGGQSRDAVSSVGTRFHPGGGPWEHRQRSARNRLSTFAYGSLDYTARHV